MHANNNNYNYYFKKGIMHCIKNETIFYIEFELCSAMGYVLGLTEMFIKLWITLWIFMDYHG